MLKATGVLMLAALLASCGPRSSEPVESVLYVFRSEAPAFLELNGDFSLQKEIPFAMPEGCSLGSLAAAPRGPMLAIELACAFGPAVLLLDTETGTFLQPVWNSDSHLLAWAPEGDAVYLRLDSVNRPRIARQWVGGRQDYLDISEYTYDLAPAPTGSRLVFSLSKGMGLGSEMWRAAGPTAAPVLMMEDPAHYIALARWSPDGQSIAFIKIPDGATPFTIGELWIMDADGASARALASADAGHGFAPAWSPDGARLAFVVRENPENAIADSLDSGLVSNLYELNVDSGEITLLTAFQSARVEGPVWQPGGDLIAFGAVVNDRMAVFLKNALTSELQQLELEGVCCAAWLRR